MFSSLRIFAFLIFVSACTHLSQRRPAQIVHQDDEVLACEFAPIFFNELNHNSIKAYTSSGYNDPIHIVYDVSRTSSHTFITYTLVKAWSEFPILHGERSHKTKFSNAAHLLDTEDVFVVLKNGSQKNTIVLFSTNTHGNYATYFSPQRYKANIAEQTSEDHNRKRLEGEGYQNSKLGFLPDIRARLEGLRNFPSALQGNIEYRSTYLDSTPLVQSKTFDHALLGFEFDHLIENEKLIKSSFKISIPSCAPQNLSQKITNLGYEFETLELVPVQEIYKNITNSEKFTNSTTMAKANLESKKISIEGQIYSTPKFPVSLDPVNYLEIYAPQLLQSLKEELGIHFEKYAYNHPIPFHFSQQFVIENDRYNSPRIDPASFFAKKFPKTWMLQTGTLEYLSFPVVNELTYRW